MNKNGEENFRCWFSSISCEDQYKFIVPFLISHDGYLNWRLKSLLHSLKTPDFLTLLPPEIQLHCLSFVDGESLLGACQVSRRWNELIVHCDSLWKLKCQLLGVNSKDKPQCMSWHRTFVLSLRQLHLLSKGRAFGEKFIHLQNSKRPVKAVDYYDGYLCTVSDEDLVNIWQLELNIPMLSFFAEESVSCVKFRNLSTLICGHFTGILTSWDVRECNNFRTVNTDLHSSPRDLNSLPRDLNSLPSLGSGLQNHRNRGPTSNPFVNNVENHDPRNDVEQFTYLKVKFRMHSGPVFSCDFDEDLGLMVSGSSDKKIKFWDLNSGTLLKTLDSESHWVLNVILIPGENEAENPCTHSTSSTYSILTMTRDSVDRYTWPILHDASEKWGDLHQIKRVACTKLNERNDNFITPGLQVSSSHLGIVKQDLQHKQATFHLLDLHSFSLRRSHDLDFKVRKLMALGQKFALLLTVGKRLYTSILVVLDVENGRIVGTYVIPHSKMTTPDGAQMIVGDTKWLDGLEGWKMFSADDDFDTETLRKIRTKSESMDQHLQHSGVASLMAEETSKKMKLDSCQDQEKMDENLHLAGKPCTDDPSFSVPCSSDPCNDNLCSGDPHTDIPHLGCSGIRDPCSNDPSINAPCSDYPSINAPCSDYPSINAPCSDYPSAKGYCINDSCNCCRNTMGNKAGFQLTSSLVLAGGIQSEEGKVFTLWWRGGAPVSKKKTE